MAVTNAELIFAEQARLYEEGLIELDEDGMYEPLYTMAVWNKMGYMIVKGQSPITRLTIWKKRPKKDRAEKLEEEEKKDNLQSPNYRDFVMVGTNFFVRRQVRPMTEEELKRRNEKKRRQK